MGWERRAPRACWPSSLAEPAGFMTMRDSAAKARRSVPRELHLRLTSGPHAPMHTHTKKKHVSDDVSQFLIANFHL